MAEKTDDTQATAAATLDKIAQTERIGLGDLVISGVLAGVAWLLLWVWEFPTILPSQWDAATVASGVRPASHVIGGYWTIVSALVYKFCGIGGGNRVLILLGHFSMALMVAGVFVFLREALAFVMRARPQYSQRRTAVMRIASAIGALAFLFADPIWSVGQCLSETTILLFLTVGAMEFFFAFLRKGSLKYSYCCAICLGLLAAESMVGFILVFGFVFINFFVLKFMPVMESPFFNPALIAVGKWYMTFFFLGALLFGIGANCTSFVLFGGAAATGNGVGAIPLAYLSSYISSFKGATDTLGWLLFFGVCFFPCLVSVIRFPMAADEEFFLKYSTGMVFLVCGILGLSQSCSLSSLWFWNYCTMNSGFLLCLGIIFTTATLAGAVTILGVDALCRNHKRLARQQFGVDIASDENANGKRKVIVASRWSFGMVRYGMLVVVPGVIICLMLLGRQKTDTRDMLEIIRDAVCETVDEAKSAKFIFTDGNLDAAIELESRRRHRELNCLALVGKNSQNPYEVYLRTRGLGTDGEDLFAFKFDAGMGLRTWMRDKPERLDQCAVQMGFDLWKRDGKALPPMGGMLSLPGGWRSEQSRLQGIANAHQLALRVRQVHARGGYKRCADKSIKAAFSAVQWRLARMCIYRGEGYDLAGRANDAIRETQIAKSLNDTNEYLQKLNRLNDKRNELLTRRLTPREGLQLALVRADFAMGRIYAEMILEALPENPDANFAMGMFYLNGKQYSRAEEYLKRCLISKPDEPAIYNNLAMIQLAIGKLDAALVNVKQAESLVPDSAAVQDTKRMVVQAINRRKSNQLSTSRVKDFKDDKAM